MVNKQLTLVNEICNNCKNAAELILDSLYGKNGDSDYIDIVCGGYVGDNIRKQGFTKIRELLIEIQTKFDSFIQQYGDDIAVPNFYDTISSFIIFVDMYVGKMFGNSTILEKLKEQIDSLIALSQEIETYE